MALASWQLVSSAASVAKYTVSAMQRSKLCLVPDGDTKTSRRLFDAMAAGCVPVVVTDEALEDHIEHLPFPETVPWERLAYHWQPDVDALAAHLHPEAYEYRRGVHRGADLFRQILANESARREESLLARRDRVQDYYTKHLAAESNAVGVVNAMLDTVSRNLAKQPEHARVPKDAAWAAAHPYRTYEATDWAKAHPKLAKQPEHALVPEIKSKGSGAKVPKDAAWAAAHPHRADEAADWAKAHPKLAVSKPRI